MKTKAKKIIIEAYEIYKENFLGKNFAFLYEEIGEIKIYEVEFEKHHFLHFTGVKTSIKALNFTSMIEDGKLNESHFEIKSDGTTFLKLNVIKSIVLILEQPSIIGKFDNTMKIKLSTERLIGEQQEKLIIGFKKAQKNEFNIPQTLLNQKKQDIKKFVTEYTPILAVFEKKKLEKNYLIIKYEKENINYEKIIETLEKAKRMSEMLKYFKK